MRVFNNFVEAKNEIARDLNELGVDVYAGYQSKDVNKLDIAKFRTKELQNYDYRVLFPILQDLEPTQPWANAEWADRVDGIEGYPMNPGRSWKQRPEVWQPLLEENGEFSYTYSQRLSNVNTRAVISSLQNNLYSRQAFISIWDPQIDSNRLGKRRVPCTLGYQLIFRNNKLDITYLMRSSDFATHFDNDVWLALKLQRYAAARLEVEPGTFTHCLTSLHVYASEVAHAF